MKNVQNRAVLLIYVEFVGKNVLWDPKSQELSLYEPQYLKTKITRKIAKLGFGTGNLAKNR